MKLLLAVVLGLATALLLAELVLRAAAWAMLHQRRGASAGEVVVLCLGDSWTFGSGSAPADSYPAQLQRELDRRGGAGRFRVINEGVPGSTAGQLLERLPRLVERYRPRVVLLLTGGLEEKHRWRTPVNGAQTAPAARGLLARLRVVRVAMTLLSTPDRRRPLELQRTLTALHGELEQILRRFGPGAAKGHCSAVGVPRLPQAGCPLEGGAGPRRHLLWAAAGRRPPPPWRPPHGAGRCAASLLVRAQVSLAQGDLARAEREARTAAAIAWDPARPAMMLGHVALARAKGWTPEALEQIRRASRRHPGYMHARLLKLQGEIALRRYRVCLLRKELEETAAICPSNRWVAQTLATTRRAMRGSRGRAILSRHDALLQRQLTAIHLHCARREARLVLINYPAAASDPCREVGIGTIRSHAAAHGLPLVELAGVLGPFVAGRPQANYIRDGHPSAKGHGLIASILAGRLIALERGWRAPAGS